MAFLPRPCVTNEQLADLSIYLHSLSYFWGSENMGANSETPTEFYGVHPSVHTSDSEIPPNSQWTSVGLPSREARCGECYVWTYRVSTDPTGPLVQLPASRLVCFYIIGW